MHNHATLRLVLWGILALILIAVLLFFLLGGAKYLKFSPHWSFGITSHKYPDSDKYSVGDASFDREVKNIRINWINGKVRICIRDDISEIRLTETISSSSSETETPDPDLQVHWLLDGDTLRVEYCASKTFYGMTRWGDKHLTLEIPTSCAASLADLKIDTVSADTEVTGPITLQELNAVSVSGVIRLDRLTTGRALVSSVSGNIFLQDVSFDTLDADTVSGDAEIAGTLGQVKIDTTSGNFRLTSSTPLRELDIDTVSGDIRLFLPEDADGFTVSFDRVSGDFICDFPTTNRGDTFIYGKGVARFSIDTVSGDVRIQHSNASQ